MSESSFHNKENLENEEEDINVDNSIEMTSLITKTK